MAEPLDELRWQMEDAAQAAFLYADKDLYLASLAISAKRIADALTHTTITDGGEQFTPSTEQVALAVEYARREGIIG